MSIFSKCNKTFFFTAGVLLFVLMLSGCGKDNDKDKDKGGPNKVTYNGKTVSVIAALQEYYGHYEEYGDDAENISLYIGNENVIIFFELFVPNGNDRLISGTYQGGGDFLPFTIIGGGIFENGTLKYLMTAAVITVSVSGNTYTIDIDGVLENGKSVSGNYTGIVERSDESEEEEAPGSMTIELDGKENTYALQEGGQLNLDLENTTGNYFMVSFPGDNDSTILTLSFMSPILNTDVLPVGQYTFTGEAAREEGNAYASIRKKPPYGQMNSTEGTVTVKKSGSTYDIRFDFMTNSTPQATVSGAYNGPLHKASLYSSSISRMKKRASNHTLLKPFKDIKP